VVFDGEWMKLSSAPLILQEDEDEEEEEEEGTVSVDLALAHQAAEPQTVPHEALDVPSTAHEAVPTTSERRHLKRVARIAEASRTCSERDQAYQACLIVDMPSLGAVALVSVCEPASYLRAMKSPERPMW
jgi:hypothetical protein